MTQREIEVILTRQLASYLAMPIFVVARAIPMVRRYIRERPNPCRRMSAGG